MLNSCIPSTISVRRNLSELSRKDTQNRFGVYRYCPSDFAIFKVLRQPKPKIIRHQRQVSLVMQYHPSSRSNRCQLSLQTQNPAEVGIVWRNKPTLLQLFYNGHRLIPLIEFLPTNKQASNKRYGHMNPVVKRHRISVGYAIENSPKLAFIFPLIDGLSI